VKSQGKQKQRKTRNLQQNSNFLRNDFIFKNEIKVNQKTGMWKTDLQQISTMSKDSDTTTPKTRCMYVNQTPHTVENVTTHRFLPDIPHFFCDFLLVKIDKVYPCQSPSMHSFCLSVQSSSMAASVVRVFLKS